MSPLEQTLNAAVADGAVPGAIGVLSRGDRTETVAVGSMTTAPDSPPLRPDAIIRIQSMTKPIVAVAALRLVENQAIALDEPVHRWLPELADRRVLRTPQSELDDTVPADGPITLRHLLTNTSGYGMIFAESPLQRAMRANQTEADNDPVRLGADDWLAALGDLPLVGQPGHVWRYHHSFAILGILLSRMTGRPLEDWLRSDIFDPLDMPDTAFTVPQSQAHRLPASYRHIDGNLIEAEPAGAGFFVDPAPFDLSHAELVSTAADVLAFCRGLTAGELISDATRAELSRDQVPDELKTPESFYPGFWETSGWGYGVGVVTAGANRGRYGWSGGAGTHMFIHPAPDDALIAILLTQVELGDVMWPLISKFEALTLP